MARCSRILSFVTLVTVLVAIGAPLVRAQAITNPNQIVGALSFSNTNPEINAFIAAHSIFPGWPVKAESVPPAPPLRHGTSVTGTSWADARYELTVESGIPGITYLVGGYLLSSSDRYNFATRTCLPVEPEPAPDVTCDLTACAGIVRVRWVDPAGAPVTVAGGHLGYSFVPGTTRDVLHFSEQARGDFAAGSQRDLLVVGDGLEHELRVKYRFGSDPYSDLVVTEQRFDVTVGCDQIVEIVVVVQPGEHDPDAMPRIVGNWDVLGKDETRHFDMNRYDFTGISATAGPFSNSRYDRIDAVPSSGPFELESLLPSSATSPPNPYRISGRAAFGFDRSVGNFFASIPEVVVPNSGTVDLGDSFVFDPATIRGTFKLVGPREVDDGNAFLDDLKLVEDADGDGVGDSLTLVPTFVAGGSAAPVPIPGLGLVCSTSASSALDGGYDPMRDSFEATFDMTAAGCALQGDTWSLSDWSGSFDDRRTPLQPESYHWQFVQVDDHTAQPITFSPGEVVPASRRYCTSELRLAFYSRAGTFYQPMLSWCYGTMNGPGHEGRWCDYQVLLQHADGTPIDPATASDRGLVVALLPEGDYELNPRVTSINPGGGESSTALRQLRLKVGCAQKINLTNDVQVQMDSIPPCVGEGLVRIAGSVQSVRPLASLQYAVDALAPVSLPLDPEFRADIAIPTGDSKVVVKAVDTAGQEASVTAFTGVAPEVSAIDLHPAVAPFVVRRDPSGQLLLAWEDLGSSDYTVQQGTLASLWRARTHDHASVACHVAGSSTVIAAPAAGSYFLVAVPCAWGSGPMGRDSFGRERPHGTNDCR